MINKVILIGNVGNTPTINNVGGVDVASFSLATTERWRNNGTPVEHTEWHNINAWRGLADVCRQYVNKGTQLYIEGRLRTQTWEKEGVKYSRTIINADTIKLLGTRSQSGAQQATTTAPPPHADMGTTSGDLPF